MIFVFRKELKYVIYKHEFAQLRPKLNALMLPDQNGTDFGYTVRSLYFDSIRDDDYYDTVDGLLKKAKIRLRIYGGVPEGETPIKLELKEKEGTDSLKRSLLLNREEAERMMKGDYRFLGDREEEAARRIYLKLIQGAYLPKTLVEYDREAYTYPAGDVRVTFDTDTRATASEWDLFDPSPPFLPVSVAGTGVLEVKYSALLPGFLKDIIRTADRLQNANSKYVQARDFYTQR